MPRKRPFRRLFAPSRPSWKPSRLFARSVRTPWTSRPGVAGRPVQRDPSASAGLDPRCRGHAQRGALRASGAAALDRGADVSQRNCEMHRDFGQKFDHVSRVCCPGGRGPSAPSPSCTQAARRRLARARPGRGPRGRVRSIRVRKDCASPACLPAGRGGWGCRKASRSRRAAPMPRSCRDVAHHGRRVAVEGVRTSARQRGATGRCAGASEHAHPLQRPDHHDHGGNEAEHLRGQHDEHGRNTPEITIHHCTSEGSPSPSSRTPSQPLSHGHATSHTVTRDSVELHRDPVCPPT